MAKPIGFILVNQLIKGNKMDRNINNQFPYFDDKETFSALLSKLSDKGFEDQCWHNEAMPHIAKSMPTEKYPDRTLSIWVDWKDQKYSELYGDAKKGETYFRFNVHLQGEYGDSDTTEFSKDFETTEEALEFVKNVLESHAFYWNLLTDQWNDWLGKQDNIKDKTIDAQECLVDYDLWCSFNQDQIEFVRDFIERWDQ